VSTLALVCTAAFLLAKGYDYYLTGSAADVQTRTTGGLMLSGGGGDVDEAFDWFIKRAGGGDIVVLRASGSDGHNKYIPKIGAVDSVETLVAKNDKAFRDPEVVSKVRRADGLFLAGGDQWNYVRMWKGTPIEDALHELWKKGIPIGGTSAGLAVLGEFSFSAQRDTVTSAQALQNPFDERVTVESDFLRFDLLEGVITDSHFSERDRLGRLLVFMARIVNSGRGHVRGIGIDERTVLLIDKDGMANVVGEGSIYVVDLASKRMVCQPATPLSAGPYLVRRIQPRDGRFKLSQPSVGTIQELNVEAGSIKSPAPK
jgi:cyanophycinase